MAATQQASDPQMRTKRMTAAKARRAIEALVAVMECVDVDGSDRVALDDARAVLDQWDAD